MADERKNPDISKFYESLSGMQQFEFCEIARRLMQGGVQAGYNALGQSLNPVVEYSSSSEAARAGYARQADGFVMAVLTKAQEQQDVIRAAMGLNAAPVIVRGFNLYELDLSGEKKESGVPLV